MRKPRSPAIDRSGIIAPALLLLTLAAMGACARSLSPAEGPGAAAGHSSARGPQDEAQRWADDILSGLALEKKIGQIICSDISGGYIAGGDPRLQQWIHLARDHGLGMFVLYGGTPRDVAHLLNRLQREAQIPLLVAADFEGGPGQQVTGASEFPANMAFAAAASEDLVYRAAASGAIEGRAMGIHLTYTPVVDIAWRPENPAESVRSFGGDLDLLGRLVRAYVRGYHDNGMLASAKHFPGRGDIERMPGAPDWSWINKPAEAVEAQEFRAFKHAIEAGVDFVMSEHIAVPSLTGGSELPASVEKKLATGWLRDRLGFQGVLTTDDLWYDHVVRRFGTEEVAVKAFEAGHDIILKPKDPAATIGALAAAVRSGRISERRIDEAARKLLVLKAQLNLHKDRYVDESRVGEFVGTPAHMAIVQEVADRSLTLLRNDGTLPVTAERAARAVHIIVQKSEADPSPAALAAKLTAAFPGIRNFTLRPDLDPAVYTRVWQAAAGTDLVILSLFVQRNRLGEAAPFRDGDLAFLRKLIAAKPRGVVAMAYGNPHLIRKIPGVAAFLVGYGERGWFGNQAVYFDTFIKALKGEIQPSGKLPVRVSEEYPIGTGVGY
ncbi:MAG: glycoside hydrolase family 3 N-terminal domain-containing protein [Acidobacteriota bacterium]